MFIFSVEMLVIAAVCFAASTYRYVYRVTTIRLIDEDLAVIVWNSLDKMFCWMAAFLGVLFSGMAVHFGTTFGMLAWTIPAAIIVGALIGRLFAVRHIGRFNEVVDVANDTRRKQIAYAQKLAPSQSEADISYVGAVGRAANITRNNKVDNAATKWLRN